MGIRKSDRTDLTHVNWVVDDELKSELAAFASAMESHVVDVARVVLRFAMDLPVEDRKEAFYRGEFKDWIAARKKMRRHQSGSQGDPEPTVPGV